MQSFKVLCHIKWVRRREEGVAGERRGKRGLKTLSHAIAAAAAAVKLKAINVPHRQTDIQPKQQQRQRQPHSNRQEVK